MATSSFVWSWSQVPWLLLICGTLWTCPIAVQAQVTDSAPNGCEQRLTAPSGRIELPSDIQYGSSIICDWVITVSSGHLVQFTIDDFYHPSYEDCKTNANVSRLELLQPTGQGGALERFVIFCWYDSFWPVRSVNNSLVVRVSLSKDTYYSLFSAHYTSINAQNVDAARALCTACFRCASVMRLASVARAPVFPLSGQSHLLVQASVCQVVPGSQPAHLLAGLTPKLDPTSWSG
ncbi:uncharacterized protein LOC143292284 [Babylonia areolata]|uniref:uncharacterized protein LOC143292284 n=1 Tax=Babylonia areolata TaxID=304850 RepID=UPI003FD4020E